MFPALKSSLVKPEHIEFFNRSSDLFRLDLIRTLLTYHLQDMVYLDSDVYVYDGFKNYLISEKQKQNKLLYFFSDTMCCFYSREPSSILDPYLERFNENYQVDFIDLKESGVTSSPNRGFLEDSLFAHFGGMGFFKAHQALIKVCSLHEDFVVLQRKLLDQIQTLPKTGPLIFCNGGALEVTMGTVSTYKECGTITKEDIIKTLGVDKNKIIQCQTFEDIFK
jgi:hypothetical protein